MRALAPDPDDRFQTMQALQIALESFARASGLALSTVALAAFMQRAVRRRARGVAGGAARGQVAGRAPGGEAGGRRVGGSRGAHRDRRVRDARRRARASRRRALRTAALAGFVALCAVAGALATKRWHDAAPAPNARRRARAEIIRGRRRRARKGIRRPTDRGKNSAVYDGDPAVATNPCRRRRPRPRRRRPNAKTKAKVKPAVIRQARARRRGPDAPVRGRRPIRAWAHGIPTPPFRHNRTYRRAYRTPRGRIIAGDVRCLLPM